MKKIIFTLTLIVFCTVSFSKPVSEYSARLAGKNFLVNQPGSASYKDGITLQLVYTASASSFMSAPNTTPQTCFFIFNSGKGFVIVSGDDAARPILAYSNEGNFDPKNISPSVSYWLNGYQTQIQYIIDNAIKASSAVLSQWIAIINNTTPPAPMASGV